MNKDEFLHLIEAYVLAKRAGVSASTITITEGTTDPAYSAVYTFEQGGSVIGVVKVPGALTVTNSQLVTDPAGYAPGTYLELEFDGGFKSYIPVSSVLDAVTTHENKNVPSQNGAHGIRYYNGALEYWNGSSWVNLPLDGQKL